MCRESDCPCGAVDFCDTAIVANIRGRWGSGVFTPLEAQTTIINAIAEGRELSFVDNEVLQRISDGRFERNFLEMRRGVLAEKQARGDIVHEWEYDGH